VLSNRKLRWFKRRAPAGKVIVVGLDCLSPDLVARYRAELPTFAELQSQGAFGLLESVIPPITVPAWACMMTGKHPGSLGIYGFRNRQDHGYDKLSVVTSADLKESTVWDRLGQVGKRSVIVGVPPGYPAKPLAGFAVSCFLTPTGAANSTYPAPLGEELQRLVGKYLFDVRQFRTENKQWLLDQIYQLSEQRFRVATYLMTHKPWDFFMFVDMGPDRFHHGFWRFFDPAHLRHLPDNPFKDAARQYYRFLDGQLKALLENAPADARVIVVSDHGAKRMDGGICINEWLMQQGYLKLKAQPQSKTPLEPALVDWPRTTAWGEGGYYSRIFLNVAGREPQGCVSPSQYESVRSELITKLEALGDESGKPIGTRVFRPQDLYPRVKGVPPDLIALFGDLHWRSVGTVGWNTVWVYENDTGPDDANHAQHGVFLAYNIPGLRGQLKNLHLTQVAGTVLSLLGQPLPPDLESPPML